METQTKDGAWYSENGIESKQKNEVCSIDVNDAISALKTLSTKCLIDVNDAISVLKILSDKCNNDNVFEQTISILESIPTVDAVPVKHGKWVTDMTGSECCSECHKYPYDDGEYHIANWHSDYCPNCGAKMDGEEQDNG